MCDIVGYVGNKRAVPILQAGLKNLEYRGYDSLGVALRETSDLRVRKQVGRINDFTFPDDDATVGVGHTRWSTHGEPTDANAHPHTDCGNRVAVVHNGIIRNYSTLRAELECDGHTFSSKTDTEIVPHLIEERLEHGEDLPDAVTHVLNRLNGAFALAVISTNFDGIVATRQGSPLVVGYGETGNFVASDIPAFIQHTREMTYLMDGDVVELTGDSVEIRADGELVDRPRHRVEWEADAAAKSGYEHYMLKEIHELPGAVRNSLAGRDDETVNLASEFLDPDSDRTLHLVGSGTSYHAALYGALLFSGAGLDARATLASEFGSDAGTIADGDVLIALSQSGEIVDTLRALRSAKDASARTLAITNTVGSTASRDADSVFYIRAGPEIGVAASKTFVTQMLSLLLLYYAGNLGAERPENSSNEEKSRIDPDARKSISTALAAIDTPDDAAQAVRLAYEQYASVKPTALTAQDALNIRQSMAYARQTHRSKWVRDLAPQLQAYFAAAEESLLMPPSRSIERPLSPAEVREILALRETRFQSGIEAAFRESENSETIEKLQRAYLWRVWDAIDVYGDFEQVHAVVEEREPPIDDLQTLPGSIQTIIEHSSAPDIAEEYTDADAYFFIGRGLHYPVALEGALKFKEITYKHAEGFAAGELKHGPLALVTERTPVFAIVTGDGEPARKTVGNVKEVEAHSAPVVAVTDGVADVERYADATLTIPEANPRTAPLLADVQLQLVAYHVANLLGRPVNKPPTSRSQFP